MELEKGCPPGEEDSPVLATLHLTRATSWNSPSSPLETGVLQRRLRKVK